MNSSKLCILVVLLMFANIMSCVNSREPLPCAMMGSGDKDLSCEDIVAEYMSNTTVAEHKIHKNNSGDVQDAVLGILIWPGLADFKNADGTEGNALLDRNVYLRNLADKKGCDVKGWPVQPKRYTESSINKDVKFCRLMPLNTDCPLVGLDI